jgi:hypothetical protein
MVADECAQEQARELVPNRLVEAKDCRRAPALDAVQASAVLEDEGEATGLRSGGFHHSEYRRRPPGRRSLPGVSGTD